MKRLVVEKSAVTLILVLCYALMEPVGCREDSPVWEHVAYMFCHAGIWHLTGNLFVLWLFSKRLLLLPGLIIGCLGSWYPVIPGLWQLLGVTSDIHVTMGFSGVLFGIIGIKWGDYLRRRQSHRVMMKFCVRVLPLALIGFFIPNINWSLHLWCLIMGFLYGCIRRE